MSSGKVKCTCGWSWNKSDSSKKDMYICHECGRDNSNNMKNGGWLDNYNDSETSAPEGYVGEGYSTKGRNYSPAWGGQFENGGSVYPVNYVPEAQLGRSIGPTPIMPLTNFLVNKFNDWFGDDKESVKKPVAKNNTRTLDIVDPRKKMATTNQPLRPNSDLVGGKYSSKHLDKLMQEAKRQGLSKEDMMNLSAMGFQETKWGRTDGNIGHVQRSFDDPGSFDDYTDFIDAYKSKMKLADRLKIKDPALRLQVYNGLGTITPKTEKDYHGFEMQKIYGVPIPKGGINMRKNPLYGKQVMDIRDNVLAKNPEYLQYMDSIYKAPVPGYMQDARVNKQSRPPGLAMGGSIPGAVGFTYARTQSPAPSNGPYAKKTKASAQNGVNVDIYNNPITAIETLNPNIDRTFYDHRTNRMMLGNDYTGWIADENLQDKVKTHENYHAKQFNSGRYNYDIAHNTDQRQWAEMQKKPSMMSTSDVWGNYYNRKGREIEEDLQNIHENYSELGFVPDELLVDKIIDKEQYNNPYSMEGEAMYYENTGKDFYKLQNGGEMNYYKKGGVIKDDLGQWAHPGEITEINSNDITMQGVPYDVLGISDTGDTKLMKPGKNYKFKGKKVTEYPMAKNGLRQEQKGLVNLDNLTNFTNYNTKQPGGWLDKY